MPKTPPIMGLGEIADYYGVSRQLAAKWSRTHEDFPEPLAVLKMGPVWRTEDVLEYGRRRERKRGEGPRPAGDPRPPSARKKTRRARVVST